MTCEHVTYSASHVIKMDHNIDTLLYFVLLYILGFIVTQSVTLETTPYDITWNAPTVSCKSRFGISVDPKPYSIRENDNNGLIGKVITLLYTGETGLYPYYTPNGTVVNGGIPQVNCLCLGMEH